MHLAANERRDKCANDAHPLPDFQTMPVMLVQRVQRSRLDVEDPTSREIFQRSFPLEAVDRLEVLLVPKNLVQSFLEDGVGQGDSHAVFAMEKPFARPA